MQKKRPDMLQMAILHHDNAPSHRATQTKGTIKRLGFELLHPPLIHQTWPLVIFQLIKSVLRGTRFEDVADLSNVAQQAIDEISVNSYR